MRVAVIVSVSLALVWTVSASPVGSEVDDLPVVFNYQQGQKCPAQRFMDDCNYCGCSKDGHSAACTLMACPPRDIVPNKDADEPIVVVHNYQQGDKCPAQKFKDDCNYCACGKDGHSAACTKKLCRPKNVAKNNDINEPTVVVHEYKQGEKCPAQSFKLDCNYCGCGKDGHSAFCTLMACPPQDIAFNGAANEPTVVVHNYQQGDKCPAQKFKDDCNLCACSSDGHHAACTKKACPPRNVARNNVPKEVPVVHGYLYGQRCPADFFMDDCNYCSCLRDGHSAACTLMACP